MVELHNLMSDSDKVNGGVWFDYEQGFECRIGSTDSPAWREVVEKLALEFQGESDGQARIDRLRIAVADVLLKGWRGLKDNGVDVPFSKEKALELLRDERLSKWREWVMDCARTERRFRNNPIRAKAVEDAKGN